MKEMKVGDKVNLVHKIRVFMFSGHSCVCSIFRRYFIIQIAKILVSGHVACVEML